MPPSSSRASSSLVFHLETRLKKRYERRSGKLFAFCFRAEIRHVCTPFMDIFGSVFGFCLPRYLLRADGSGQEIDRGSKTNGFFSMTNLMPEKSRWAGLISRR
jgi:hypothetical protein